MDDLSLANNIINVPLNCAFFLLQLRVLSVECIVTLDIIILQRVVIFYKYLNFNIDILFIVRSIMHG